VLRSPDGTEAIIPNETMVSSTVVNHSYTDRVVRIDIPIQVSYQSDLDLAMRLMRQAAEQHPRVVQKPEPMALLTGFADSGVNLELYTWIEDPERGKADLKSDLYLAIWRAFKVNSIDIPFPQREIRILPASDAIPIRPAA
jgi:small-conductance mechanosensitive channel